MGNDSNVNSSNGHFTHGVHEIDPNRDISITVRDETGAPAELSQFRASEERPDDVMASVLYRPQDGDLIAEQMWVPKRLEAAKAVTMEFVDQHHEGLKKLGKVALIIAASTGIAVKVIKLRSKKS